MRRTGLRCTLTTKKALTPRPAHKSAKDSGKLNRYRIRAKQNTVGKLMERIVGREVASDIEDREIFPGSGEKGGGGG